jgi:hypothetical protein
MILETIATDYDMKMGAYKLAFIFEHEGKQAALAWLFRQGCCEQEMGRALIDMGGKMLTMTEDLTGTAAPEVADAARLDALESRSARTVYNWRGPAGIIWSAGYAGLTKETPWFPTLREAIDDFMERVR